MAALAVVGIPALAGRAAAVEAFATWTGSAGSWTTAANWSSNPLFPNDGGGTTWTAVVNTAAADLTLDAPITISRYHHLDGRLDTDGRTLAVLSQTRWDGGAIVGSGTIDLSGELVLSGGDRLLSGVTINAAATATTQWLAGVIGATESEGGVFNNAGLFEDHTDARWTWVSTRTPAFNNTGTYRKLAGSTSNAHRIEALFNNDGTVAVQAGHLWLAGGGVSGGTFAVAAGARLSFSDFAADYSGAGAIPTRLGPSSVVAAGEAEVLFRSHLGDAGTDVDGTFDAGVVTAATGLLGELRFNPGARVQSNIGTASLLHFSGRTQFNTGQFGGVAFRNAVLYGGTIDGGDEISVENFHWDAGTIRGTGGQAFNVVGPGGIAGPGPKFLERRTYNAGENATAAGGDLNLTDSDISNSNGSVWTNRDGPMRFGDNGGTFISRFFADGTFISNPGAAGQTIDFELVEFNTGFSGRVNVDTGRLRLGGGGTHAGTITIAAGAELDLSGGEFNGAATQHAFFPSSRVVGGTGSTLRFSGPGTTSFAGSGSVGQVLVDSGFVAITGRLTADMTRVGSDSHVEFSAGTFETGTLDVRGTGRVAMFPGSPDKTLRATGLAIETAGGAVLDVANHGLIVDYADASPIVAVRSLLQSGFAGGAWSGPGITSVSAANASSSSKKTGVGYAEATDLFTSFPAVFGAYSIDNTVVLARYTLLGDANLDRVVNIADFGRLAAHFNSPGRWFDGDFNYDGKTGIGDFSLLAANFNQSLPAETSRPGSVPEPGALATMAVGLAGSLRRRRHSW